MIKHGKDFRKVAEGINTKSESQCSRHMYATQRRMKLGLIPWDQEVYDALNYTVYNYVYQIRNDSERGK